MIRANPTIYCDVQFSHIQRSRQELERELTHSKYTAFSTTLALGSILTLITDKVKVPIVLYIN